MPERRITWHNGTTLLPVTWQSQHRNLAWTTHKPKNIQNRLAAFLYFLSGLVPCLFLWSHLQPLLAAEYSIPYQLLLLLSIPTISFGSSGVFCCCLLIRYTDSGIRFSNSGMKTLSIALYTCSLEKDFPFFFFSPPRTPYLHNEININQNI